jgi:hypothetical protein
LEKAGLECTYNKPRRPVPGQKRIATTFPTQKKAVDAAKDTARKQNAAQFLFGVYHLVFVARCAREDDDAGEVRLSKIQRIIEECRFGIKDLS